jgi:4-amino-4-deoxy-L-arabinose transferase-like glycosyltransferase
VIPHRQRNPIWLILLGAAIVRLAFAFQTPAWEAPDEYAHYWYAEQITYTGSYPVATHSFPDYEAYQPPLYYRLASFLLDLSDQKSEFSDEPLPPSGRLLILRLFSVCMGVLTVWVVYRILLRMKKLTPDVRLWATAFVAFLPTLVGTNATVNNDTMVTLLSAFCLLIAARGNWTATTAFWCGLFAGLALLTKLNAVVLLPIILIRLWQISRGDKQGVIRRGLSAVIPWIACAVLLAMRNVTVYNSMLALNPGAESGFSITIENTLRAVRNLTWSFWLAFGRAYTVRPGALVYLATALPLMLASLIGWIRMRRPDKKLLTVALSAIVLSMTASMWYTLSYPAGTMTSWGKNLFPVLPLIAVLLTVGWREIWPKRPNVVPAVAVVVMGIGCIWGLITLSMMT